MKPKVQLRSEFCKSWSRKKCLQGLQEALLTSPGGEEGGGERGVPSAPPPSRDIPTVPSMLVGPINLHSLQVSVTDQ